MIKIKLWPDLIDWPVNMSVDGLTLEIDGEKIDLSVIPDGYKLPGSAVSNRWFVAHEFIERHGDTVSLALRYPVQWESPVELRCPAVPVVIECVGGKVLMPDATPKKDEFEFTPVTPQESSND